MIAGSRGVWVVRALVALVALAGPLLPLGPGAPAPAAAQSQAAGGVWRLERVLDMDVDGRGAQAGTVSYQAQGDASGGSITLRLNGKGSCGAAPTDANQGSEDFVFTWAFSKPLTQVSRGDSFTITFDGDSQVARAPCRGGPDGPFAPYTFAWVNAGWSVLLEKRGAELGITARDLFEQRGGDRYYPKSALRPGQSNSPPYQMRVPDGATGQPGQRAFLTIAAGARPGAQIEVAYIFTAVPPAAPVPTAAPAPVLPPQLQPPALVSPPGCMVLPIGLTARQPQPGCPTDEENNSAEALGLRPEAATECRARVLRGGVRQDDAQFVGAVAVCYGQATREADEALAAAQALYLAVFEQVRARWGEEHAACATEKFRQTLESLAARAWPAPVDPGLIAAALGSGLLHDLAEGCADRRGRE